MLRALLLFLLYTAMCCPSASAQEIVSIEFLKNRSLATIKSEYLPFAENGVDLYRVLYTTRDLAGMRDTASGLLVVPDLEETVFPLLIYQHGTVSAKDDVPSQLQGGYQIAEGTGSFGYVTLAPDFLGLGTSRGLHPYVHAASEAWVAVDMLKAVKSYLPQLDVQVNEQIFITGYSQGGHAAMALHRELEQNHAEEFKVTAAAPMSGPYSISGEMKKLFLSQAEYGYPAYLAFTILSYNAAYGLYDELEDYFEPAFARLIAQFRDHQLSLSTLNTLLQAGLREKHGASIPIYMLQESVRTAALNDPSHPLNRAMADNDVYKWKPLAPTRLFYCRADDQVPYTNSLIAQDTMQVLGAADLQAIDVKSDADHGGCVLPAGLSMIIFFAGFRDAQTAVAAAPVLPDLRIFPNPARSVISIEGLETGHLIELFNLRGQRQGLWIAQGDRLDVPLSGNWQGMHLLRITTERGSRTEKVVLAP